jgi:hypothetical protein
MFLGHGYGAVVFSVSRGGRRLALRLRWSPEQTRGEADALAACRAHRTVELVAADVPRGALLLGRLAGDLRAHSWLCRPGSASASSLES